MLETVTMPAGEYFVCDPCYVVPEDRWTEWLEAAGLSNQSTVLHAPLDGHMILGLNTAYGDGEYYDQQGRAYGVDAGLIGVTPVEIANDRHNAFRTTFPDDFECSRDDDGTLTFGDIVINTGDVEEDDENANFWD